ncbi:MAG TPA: ABC transporter substrate-binding protein, partial [Nitrososphaeraceae archaeon]|nr:ABC transporter substrate-binding protein [Nitrososphaeraceae archaeon]
MQHTNMQTITIKQSTTIIALVTVAIILIAIPIANISSPVGAQQQEQQKNTSTQTLASNTTTTTDGVKKTLRIGYFPNINHAQAVIGLGNGDFEKELGNNVTVQTFVFNAGPSAIEALLAKKLDVTYVGSNPAINGYVVSEGDLKIVSGATSGGASFVIRNDAKINSVKDLGGKKFASPQLGNTQDVALRKY